MSSQVLATVEPKMQRAVEVMERDFTGLRTGRASTALVERIQVEYYGTLTPLNQLAGINVPEPHQIVIQPWDKNVMPDIEKAILKSDIGITPTNDGKVIRLSMPPLTQERRQELDKVLKKIAEDGHVSIRTARHAAIETVRKSEKDKIITEDEKFKTQDDIQKLTDKYIKEIDNMLAAKEKEIAG